MLEAQNLAARRGFARLFDDLSFSIGPGEALQVTGANGSGKTTLLRTLAGLSAPASGRVLWRGRPAAPFDPALRADLLFVGHAPALKDELTAEENLASLVRLAGAIVARADVQQALERVALKRQRALPASVLSQGQRRRVGLARMLLVPRALWILDEPLTALDSAGAGILATIMSEHLERGGMAVAATHAPLDLPAPRVRSLGLG